jgi:hypothetical protein
VAKVEGVPGSRLAISAGYDGLVRHSGVVMVSTRQRSYCSTTRYSCGGEDASDHHLRVSNALQIKLWDTQSRRLVTSLNGLEAVMDFTWEVRGAALPIIRSAALLMSV